MKGKRIQGEVQEKNLEVLVVKRLLILKRKSKKKTKLKEKELELRNQNQLLSNLTTQNSQFLAVVSNITGKK